MGRFKSDAILVRVTTNLIIYFIDHEKILVKERGTNQAVVFHRYGAPLGSYENSWHPFRTKLQRYQNLTMRRCHQIAIRHSVLYFSTERLLDLSHQTVRYRR